MGSTRLLFLFMFTFMRSLSFLLSLSITFIFILYLTELLPSAMLFSQVHNVRLARREYDEDDLTMLRIVSNYASLETPSTQADFTHLFRGWNEADTTGASNRTTAFRRGGSLSDARSQIHTFQSLLAVNTYLEFREKLHEPVKRLLD